MDGADGQESLSDLLVLQESLVQAHEVRNGGLQVSEELLREERNVAVLPREGKEETSQRLAHGREEGYVSRQHADAALAEQRLEGHEDVLGVEGEGARELDDAHGLQKGQRHALVQPVAPSHVLK